MVANFIPSTWETETSDSHLFVDQASLVYIVRPRTARSHKREGVILAHGLRVQSLLVGEGMARGACCDWSHGTCSEEAEGEGGRLAPLLVFIQSGTPPHRILQPMLRVVFSPQRACPETPHRQSQRSLP